MQKVYQRINWENEPSTKTALGEDNLNKMDYALDKIDDRVVNLSGYETRVAESERNAKQSEINAKESEINAKESELKAKQYMETAFSGTPEGYSALVNQVGLLDIATSTGNALYNSKKGGYRLNELVGATEQKQLSGKNLFGGLAFANALVQSGANANIDGEYVKLQADNNASSFQYINFKENTQYTFFIKGVNTIGTSNSSNLGIEYTDGTVSSLDFAANGAMNCNVSTSGKSIKRLVGIYYTGRANILYNDFGIFEGVLTLDDFEPYCGGIPSPNQDFPQAIENTFDCVEMIQGSYNPYTGGWNNNTTYVCNKRSIPCKSGDIVEIKCNNMEHFRLIYRNENGLVSYSGQATDKVTVPSGVTHFDFNIGNTNGLTPQTVGKISLTINGKCVGQIVEHGKNLFIKSKATDGYGCGYTGVPYADSNLSISDYIEVDSTKKYVVYGIQWVNWFDEKRSHIKIVSESVLTPPSNAKYIRITYSLSLKDKVQLEVGETVTEYEEGKEIVTTFFLNEPLCEGDRIVRKDGVIGVEKKRAIKVFNNSSSIVTIENIGTVLRIAMSINKAPATSYSKSVCDSLINLVDYGSNTEHYYITGGFVYLFVNVSRFSSGDTTGVGKYLESNPITVEYELATPTLTPLDTASQIALNGLETFKDVTYLEVDSKIPPTSISGEYGTSQVGAYTLKCMNDNDTDRVERAEMKARLDELAVALVSQ